MRGGPFDRGGTPAPARSVTAMAGMLHAYEYVPYAASEIVALLEQRPDILAVPTRRALQRAESIRSRLRITVGGFEVGRDAEICLGEVMVEPGAARIPIAWKAASQSTLFPHMTAAIQVTSISDDPPEACIALVGSYTPPFGLVGAVGDLLLGHQVAEATVREFIDGLARRVTQELASADRETVQSGS